MMYFRILRDLYIQVLNVEESPSYMVVYLQTHVNEVIHTLHSANSTSGVFTENMIVTGDNEGFTTTGGFDDISVRHTFIRKVRNHSSIICIILLQSKRVVW